MGTKYHNWYLYLRESKEGKLGNLLSFRTLLVAVNNFRRLWLFCLHTTGEKKFKEFVDKEKLLRKLRIFTVFKGQNEPRKQELNVVSIIYSLGKAGCRFKNTILFVAFDFEEDTAESEHPIPFGSQWFVRNITKHLHRTGGTIKGAFILEMLANHNTSRGCCLPTIHYWHSCL